jgi:hypothetical protein
MIYQILVVASQEVAALQLNHDQLCTDQATGELAEPLNMVEFTKETWRILLSAHGGPFIFREKTKTIVCQT